MKKYEKFSIHSDWDIPVKSFKEYKEMLEHSPFEYIKHRCLKEMYERAQPSVNLDNLLKEHFDRLSKGLEAESFYERYYLSYEECTYILDKYVEQWYLKDPWHDYFELIISDAQKRYFKDKWIPDHTDKYGNNHPGHRGYEDVMPLRIQIEKALNSKFKVSKEVKKALEKLRYKFNASKKIKSIVDSIETSKEANKINKLFIDFLKERENFYYHDRNENALRCQVCLGISPNSNAEAVKKYWKEKGIDLDIDLRKHSNDYFYCEEQGYTKEELKELEEHESKHSRTK